MNSFADRNRNKRRASLAIAAMLLLLTPLVAMQFTEAVNWSPGDFLAMGVLLLGLGLTLELVLSKVRQTRHRLLLCLAVLVVFLLVWVELAVGIFGTPVAGS